MKHALSIAFPLIAAVAHAQADPADVDRIVQEGKNRNQVMRTLRSLTNIGPRVTGSPKLRKAQEWAMSEFRRYGLTNVHLEKWGDVPVGFQRGDRQTGRMVTPYDEPIVFTTPCWTPGTNGPLRAEAVMAPKDMADFEARKEQLKGKWLVMPGRSGVRGGPAEPAELKAAVDKLGIAGRISGSADARVHTGGNWRGKTYENRPKDRAITVSRPDYERIVRNIGFGRKTELEFDIDNQWFKGPIDQFNVIADIKGTEKPDEMVIISGHLDSWNSPGSQGACDNGTGSSVAIEAARILMASGVKPKRTIRFILWSGEEQGLFGSRAYVEMHKDELDKISAVLNDDGGTNYQGGYVGVEAMRATMEAAFAPTVKAFPDLPMAFTVVPTMPLAGSSDHAPFNQKGVPGFFTKETGRADYGHVWHTQFDRYENAIPEYLVQSSTNHAVVAFNLANAPTLLARAPKPEPRREAIDLDHEEAVGGSHMHDDHDHSSDYWLDRIDRLPRWLRQALPGLTR